MYNFDFFVRTFAHYLFSVSRRFFPRSRNIHVPYFFPPGENNRLDALGWPVSLHISLWSFCPVYKSIGCTHRLFAPLQLLNFLGYPLFVLKDLSLRSPLWFEGWNIASVSSFFVYAGSLTPPFFFKFPPLACEERTRSSLFLWNFIDPKPRMFHEASDSLFPLAPPLRKKPFLIGRATGVSARFPFFPLPWTTIFTHCSRLFSPPPLCSDTSSLGCPFLSWWGDILTVFFPDLLGTSG